MNDIGESNIRLMVYDVDILRFMYPEWDCLNKKQKLTLLRNISYEAIKRIKTHNVTCTALHEYLARNIDPEQSNDEEGNKILFGDDNSSFNASDTSLNNKVGETDLADSSFDSSNNETTFTAFLDSSELNSETLAELGLESTAGNLWNHAGISPTISKTASETVVADIFIKFSDS